jgi:hypothetical protein
MAAGKVIPREDCARLGSWSRQARYRRATQQPPSLVMGPEGAPAFHMPSIPIIGWTFRVTISHAVIIASSRTEKSAISLLQEGLGRIKTAVGTLPAKRFWDY